MVYLQVALTQRFDGRLWLLPSRVHSGVLTLAAGERLSVDDLARRLERSGYARTHGAPRKPGQYSVASGRVEAHIRPFVALGHDESARRRTFVFRGDRLAEIRDARGRPLARALLEPEVIATLYGARQEERQPIRIDDVPPVLIDAVLAAEDARFFDHHGLDPRGILRAAWANLRKGRVVQGGSTITQQTVKNLFLGQERTWWRKSREGLLSVMLEAGYPKERILEVYLNEVYLGQRGPVAICGVQAASRYYFGRDVADLTLAESGLLAGLIRNPGGYNPFARPEKAVARRDQVLVAMARLGLASSERVEAARVEPLHLASGGGGFSRAPYAVEFVRSQVQTLYSEEILERDGLEIYTTIDTRWQEAAERSLAEGLERLERDAPTVRRQSGRRSLQGAVVVTEPQSGRILAMVGGRDYSESQFNRAVQAHRQPGSCFKPFVFAAGFEREIHGEPGGFTPATLLDDSPYELTSGGEPWRPENYDREFRGPVSVRRALEESLNVPTVRAAAQVGVARVIETARACGIDSALAPVPSLALGVGEVTPLELSAAYGTLARLGDHVTSWIVQEITDREGRPLARHEGARTRAISSQTAFIVNDLLEGVVERGTARSAAALGYRGRASGKTGTTDETRDAWFVGYTPELLALVWVGYDDNARTGLTGATGALPIWVELMRRGPAVAAAGEARSEPPWGLVQRRIDPATGGLVQRGCPEWKDEWFARGTEPTKPCGEHRGGRFRRWFRRVTGR